MVVFVCANIVGVLLHTLMEHAQRRAFLDTRNCIAARLEMEDENEKLVSVLMKILLFQWTHCTIVLYPLIFKDK